MTLCMHVSRSIVTSHSLTTELTKHKKSAEPDKMGDFVRAWQTLQMVMQRRYLCCNEVLCFVRVYTFQPLARDHCEGLSCHSFAHTKLTFDHYATPFFYTEYVEDHARCLFAHKLTLYHFATPFSYTGYVEDHARCYFAHKLTLYHYATPCLYGKYHARCANEVRENVLHLWELTLFIMQLRFFSLQSTVKTTLAVPMKCEKNVLHRWKSW